MKNSESAYCCIYCRPKITLYLSTDKYDGICQNCIGLLAIQAIFKSTSYKHSFSLFKGGYFKQDRMAIKLDQKGEAIDQYYEYLHNGPVEWDTWLKDDLASELLSRAKQWYDEFGEKKYPIVSDEIGVYMLRFWNEKSLVTISVSSPGCWSRKGAYEMNEFSAIWNTLKERGGNDDELAAIYLEV
jgi:hypothetical protein